MTDQYDSPDQTDLIPDWDPDAADEPPTYAPGIYGQQGEATLTRMSPVTGTYSKGPNAGQQWASMGVSVEIDADPEIGKRTATSQLFGAFGMSLQSKSGSLWPQIAANLGIRPGQPIADFVGMKVLVDVVHTKDRDGSKRLTIKNLWPAATQG